MYATDGSVLPITVLISSQVMRGNSPDFGFNRWMFPGHMIPFHVRHILLVIFCFLLPGCPSSDLVRAQTITLQGTQIDVDILGNIWILNAERNTLHLYDKAGVLQREVGGPGWLDGQFDRPSGVWARNGIDVFVADYGNHRIQRFDRQLAFVSSLSTRDSDVPDQRFGYPTDVALSRMGDLFICDGENQRVVKVNRLSQVEKAFGGFDAGRGKLEKPTRIAIGPLDNVYVLDGSRILVFDSFGNFLHELYEKIWKQPSVLYGDDNRILIVDQGTLHCFDRQERSTGNVVLSDVVPGLEGEVRSIGANQGKLYLLSASGLTTIADPCPTADRIDK
jgi:hypothetical protein